MENERAYGGWGKYLGFGRRGRGRGEGGYTLLQNL